LLTKEEQNLFYGSIGSKIRAARIQADLKQEVLATRLGFVSHISIVNIESGKQKIQLHTLVEIADFLNIPLEDLLPPLSTIKKDISNKMLKSLNKEAAKELSNNPDALKKLEAFIKFSSAKTNK
jgi:transcriptional regulator with XRE-family HTH domain